MLSYATRGSAHLSMDKASDGCGYGRAASSAGTSLEANLKHITVTLATWDAVWEVYLDPKWARQRLRLYRAHDRALEHIFKKMKLQEDMAEVPMERHGRAKHFLLSSQDWPWGAPPPAKRSKHTEAEQAAEPTQSTQSGKGTGKTQGMAAKAKPAPQPGRWLDRDCNAALNMQRIGASRWRPLELCYWPEQGYGCKTRPSRSLLWHSNYNCDKGDRPCNTPCFMRSSPVQTVSKQPQI
ncbi:hypothetical protein QJQ45_003567 [Haematococcus lacustris]|nr:hypothetical protein QJQ45_003567 [Haematococcus lacustris]